jgi:hypothetical protein
MKTIKDYLIEGGYYHFTQYGRLYDDTQTCFGFPNSIQLQLVKIAVKEVCPKPSLHPNLLVELLAKMGIVTGPQLVAWLDGDHSLLNTQGYADIINPPVPDLGDMEEINWTDARRWVKERTGIHPLKLHNDDMVYRLIKPEMLLPVAADSPMNYCEYIPERRDCENFVNGTLGWLARWGYGNLVFGRADVLLKTDNKELPHVIHLILDSNRDVWMYEPQVKTYVWKYGNPAPINIKLTEARI